MKQKKVEAIVINEKEYSESSKILTLYSKDLGIISVISKGCRRLKSPLRTVSNKLSYGDYILSYKEDGLSTLISADIKDNFKNILLNINNLSYASYILELTYQVAKQNEDPHIFDLFIETLLKINEGFDPEILTLILELKYLKYLGIDINVDECSICSSQSNIITLNVDKGGYICKDCYQNEPLVSDKSIKVFRMFYYVDISKISKLKLSKDTVKEISKFLEDYYDKYSGLYLKSKKFLNILTK